ncbi:unnamed protein product [Brassica rapa subsp. trilocularis]
MDTSTRGTILVALLLHLLSSQIGKQMNLTCIANGRTEMYKLSNDNTSHVQQLCSQLCSWY